MKYVLEMNEKQAEVTKKALEFYARIVIGQWKEVGELCLDIRDEDYAEKMDAIANGMDELRRIVYPELLHGASYGVASKEKSLAAWEVYQVLRHCIAWTRHLEGGSAVDFATPVSFSGEELAKCRAEDDEKTEKKR